MVQPLAAPLGLVDTNILVYVVDLKDLGKTEQAETLVHTLASNRRGVLSAQCLSEFFNTATSRLRPPLSRSEAGVYVERWVGTFPVLDITSIAVLEAARRAALSQMSIWDALIWAVAKTNGVPLVLTEDVPGGRNAIDGVRYANPFAAGFDLARVLPGT